MKTVLLVCALLLGASRLEAAFTTPVQTATMTTLPGAPVTLAFGSNVTNGNLIIVIQTWGASAGSFTVSKSAGTATIGTCTSDKAVNDAVNGQSIGLASCFVTGTGSLTMQGDDAAHSAFTSIAITEWAGAAASPADVFGGQVTTGTSLSTGAITTTTNGDLVIAGYMNDAGSATITAGSGWTNLTVAGSTIANTLYTEYQVQTSSGSITGTANQSASQRVVSVIGSYKAAGGGGGVTCGARALIGVGC